jgi:ATP-binding cassette subfamily G (WHITE) protein 2
METIPNWKFLDALSYVRYGYFVAALNELSGLDIACDTGKKCTTTSGEQILSSFGYDRYTMRELVGYLFLLNFGFRLIAYLGLRFIKS